MSIINTPLDNKVLEAAEQKIESALLPAVRDDYMKIVVAGMQAAAHNGPNGMLSGLKSRKDPISDCAIGAINLVVLMSHQSRGAMPMKALVPAAMTLMLHALDLVQKMGLAKIGPDELGRATRVFTNHLFTVLKISPAMLKNMATKVHGVMQDPTQMETISRRAGVVRDPRASQPTQASEEPNV